MVKPASLLSAIILMNAIHFVIFLKHKVALISRDNKFYAYLKKVIFALPI